MRSSHTSAQHMTAACRTQGNAMLALEAASMLTAKGFPAKVWGGGVEKHRFGA
jgi:hypothetical protein